MAKLLSRDVVDFLRRRLAAVAEDPAAFVGYQTAALAATIEAAHSERFSILSIVILAVDIGSMICS